MTHWGSVIGLAGEIASANALETKKIGTITTTLLLLAPQAYNGSLTALGKELHNQPLEILNSDNLNLKSAAIQVFFALIGSYSMDKGIDSIAKIISSRNN